MDDDEDPSQLSTAQPTKASAAAKPQKRVAQPTQAAQPQDERRDAVAASRDSIRQAIVARSGIDAAAIPASTPKSEVAATETSGVEQETSAVAKAAAASDYKLPSAGF